MGEFGNLFKIKKKSVTVKSWCLKEKEYTD